MNTIPGFNGEASLSPTIGTYRGKAGFGGSGKGEVLPMQEFPASSTLSRNLNLGFVGSTFTNFGFVGHPSQIH